MSVREAIAHLHAIEGEIVGADVVEYNPAHDLDGITATVTANSGLTAPGTGRAATHPS